MSFLNPFSQNLRRSSSLLELHSYEDFMVYASECRDEIEVYLYMEEEKIGIDEPGFWMAMLVALKERCQLKLFVKKLTQVKQMAAIREHPKIFDIMDLEMTLIRELELEIHRRKNNKRRSVREFELFSVSKIQKKTRKIGAGDASFEIYVDQENREKYKLNDLSEFVIDEMTEYVLAKARNYEQKRAHKPYSFLGKHQNDLEKWSKELIEANKRKSQMLAASNQANTRQSNIQRNTQKRISVSRKSNALYENNPEKMTPNVPTKIPLTPSKYLRTSQIYRQRQSDIFSTPKVQTTLPRNIIKAKNKIEEDSYSFRLDSSEDELSVLQKELYGLDRISGHFQDAFECFGQREVIRLGHEQNEVESSFVEEAFQEVNLDSDLYEKKEKLNLGVLDISGVDERESKSFPKTFLDLKHSIWDEKPAEKKDSSDNESPQVQLRAGLNLNDFSPRKELKQKLSNDQNIFTNEKPRFPLQSQFDQFRPFKKLGQPFRVLTQQEILQRQNYYKCFHGMQQNEQEISQIEDTVSIESEGKTCYKEMIEEIQKSVQGSRLRGSQNLVLETMKKVRLEEVYQREVKKEQFHPNGICSEKKRITPARLAKISEENSYNSERKLPGRKSENDSPFYREEQVEEENEI